MVFGQNLKILTPDKVIPSERVSQGEHNSGNFSSAAPSTEKKSERTKGSVSMVFGQNLKILTLAVNDSKR